MLEAAFDGEVDEMKPLIDRGGDPECSDNHGNTCLLRRRPAVTRLRLSFFSTWAEAEWTQIARASSGGPRACFMGKTDVIPILLVAGADPRIPNETGETCGMVASSEARMQTFCLQLIILCNPPSPAFFPQNDGKECTTTLHNASIIDFLPLSARP
jgi:ankyrin repeat protein